MARPPHKIGQGGETKDIVWNIGDTIDEIYDRPGVGVAHHSTAFAV
jgi:hypothetical protein